MKQYIQISSGRGPEECCFAVSQVLKKLIKLCKADNCYHEVISREESGINGNLHSAILMIDTKNNPSILEGWIGTIQWISQSPFRKHHKRKNWFVGVNSLPHESILDLNVKDVVFETFRSGGAGGQHVNKVSTAVRATHQSTGLAVKVTDTRSQHQNKRLALERIMKMWSEFQCQNIQELNESGWINHMNIQRGNPVKIFTTHDFKLKSEPKKFRNKRGKEKLKWKRELDN